MTIMVDASAIVAIILDEPEAGRLLMDMERDTDRRINGVALWESARALSRKGPDLEASLLEVERHCASLGILIVPIAAAEASEAVWAQARYGKGNHPARLNMGDCFAYACAKTNGARLLYKGDDFAQTDLS